MDTSDKSDAYLNTTEQYEGSIVRPMRDETSFAQYSDTIPTENGDTKDGMLFKLVDHEDDPEVCLNMFDEVLYLHPSSELLPCDALQKSPESITQAWTEQDRSQSAGSSLKLCQHDNSSTSEIPQPQCMNPCSLHIHQLPNELLRKIFSYCTQRSLCQEVAPICRHWRDLAYDPIHWQELTLNIKQLSSHKDLIPILIRAPLLKHLSMKADIPSNVELIPQLCPHLKTLDLGFNEAFDEDALEYFSNGCNLQSINIEGCQPVGDCSVSYLCQMTTLRSINLSHCQAIQDHHIIQLAEALSDLRELNIDGISWITDRGVLALVDHHCGSLVCLELDGAELTDDGLQAVATCRQLQVLTVSFCELLTDATLTALQTMENLKHLKLKKGVSFSSEGLREMFAAGYLKNLETLNLAETINLCDEGVKALVQCCSSSLTNLDLSWCWNMTEDGLQAIIQNCRKICHLTLVGQKQITGDCLSDVPKLMPKLENLDLTQCNEINDELIQEVFTEMPSTTVLDYYGQDFSGVWHYDQAA